MRLILKSKLRSNAAFFYFLFAVSVFSLLYDYGNLCSGSSSGSLMEAGVFWSLLMIVSFLFQAADTVLKVEGF